MTRIYGINLDNDAEVQRYLSGAGKDVTSESYRYYRAEIEKAYVAHQAARRLDEPRQIRAFHLPMPPTAGDCQRWSDEVARDYRIKVVERDVMPVGVEAFASWHTRSIVVKPFAPDLSTKQLVALVATRGHETGHILAGECPGTRPHHRDAAVSDWWHCTPCETAAWEIAFQLVTFSRPMFDEVKRHLGLVRRTYPAHPEAKTAARQLASDSAYARSVLARAERARRLEQHAEMEAFAAEAQRPRRRSKLEQPIADIRRWSKE